MARGKIPFYYLQYGPFVISTARPETKFGDKYVVMHPDDERYAAYADGQKLTVEWINGPIEATIVKDTVIDMAFGTGVMTITPGMTTPTSTSPNAMGSTENKSSVKTESSSRSPENSPVCRSPKRGNRSSLRSSPKD